MTLEGLDELYREVVLDHYRHPQNRGTIENPSVVAEGSNPFCGDEVALYLKLDDGHVTDVAFTGRGCSISQASASMMTDVIKGKSLEEVRALFTTFRGMMHGEGMPGGQDLGDLEALEGVRKYPIRIKCALLAWTTLQDGLESHQVDKTVPKGNRHQE